MKVTEQFNSSDAVDVLADAIAALTGGPAALDAAIVAKKAATALASADMTVYDEQQAQLANPTP